MGNFLTINNKNKYCLALLICSVVALFIIAILFGAVRISFSDIISAVFGGDVPEYIKDIIVTYRIPRAITALLCGYILAICGLQMQTLIKNPLADPYILGVSSGAGLGVALFVMGFSVPAISAISGTLGNLGMVAAAWIGSIAVTLIILSASARLKDNLSLLILGVMIGAVASAIIGLLQYASSETALKSYILWSMGSFSALSYDQVKIILLLAVGGTLLSVYNIKDLNVMLLGEGYSKALGVDVRKVRIRVLITVTLMAGGITAFCGPIGFVGIAAPHIARMIFKDANHKILLPASALCGTVMMQSADIITQLISKTGAVPINSISALLGIPVIIYIILKKK